MEDARKIYCMALWIARAVRGRGVVTWAYAARVARLLCMTAAHESGLVHRRQIGFSVDSEDGAFSLWQFERASVCDSVGWLNEHALSRMKLMKALEVISEPSASALGGLGYGVEGEKDCGVDAVLRLVQEPEGDILACALARLHYIRFASPVPGRLEEMAVMAKEQYNTAEGKATVEKYLSAYRRLFGWMEKGD